MAAKKKSAFVKVENELRDFAMAYPEAHEDFPWGERAIKVNKKVFVFMYSGDGKFHLSVKLPQSSAAALLFPFAQPTGYGLGKSGWVSSVFEGKDSVPAEILKKWIAESYRAVAPKKLVKTLDGAPAEAPIKKKVAAKKKAPAKKKVEAKKKVAAKKKAPAKKKR
jgi:predicted DNA-binding protein (MmcQ/YjbR family)